MPRAVRDSDEESEAKSDISTTGRRTRASVSAVVTSATDSPSVRRSTRSTKAKQSIEHQSSLSPKELADDTSTTTVGRTTRSKAATLEKGTSVVTRSTRSRKNSATSEQSEANDLEEFVSKRTTRKVSTASSIATPTKINLRVRNLREGSEPIQTPPVIRTRRFSRSGSVDSQGSETTAKTPLRRRTRASIVPAEPTVLEEQEIKSQHEKTLDSTVTLEDTETSSEEKSTHRSIRVEETNPLNVAKELFNDSGKSSLGSSKKLEDSLIENTDQSTLKTCETQTSKNTLESFITALDKSTYETMSSTSSTAYQTIATKSNISVVSNDQETSSSTKVLSIVDQNDSNDDEVDIINIEEIKESVTPDSTKEVGCSEKIINNDPSENVDSQKIDIKKSYVKLNRISNILNENINDTIDQNNETQDSNTDIVLTNDYTIEKVVNEQSVEIEDNSSNSETTGNVELTKNLLNTENVVFDVDSSDDNDYHMSIDDDDDYEEAKAFSISENKNKSENDVIDLINEFTQEKGDTSAKNDNDMLISENETFNNNSKENNDKLNSTDKENSILTSENKKIEKSDNNINSSCTNNINEKPYTFINDKFYKQSEEIKVSCKYNVLENKNTIRVTNSDNESDNMSIIEEINSIINDKEIPLTQITKSTESKISVEEYLTITNDNIKETVSFKLETNDQLISNERKENFKNEIDNFSQIENKNLKNIGKTIALNDIIDESYNADLNDKTNAKDTIEFKHTIENKMKCFVSLSENADKIKELISDTDSSVDISINANNIALDKPIIKCKIDNKINLLNEDNGEIIDLNKNLDNREEQLDEKSKSSVSFKNLDIKDENLNSINEIKESCFINKNVDECEQYILKQFKDITKEQLDKKSKSLTSINNFKNDKKSESSTSINNFKNDNCGMNESFLIIDQASNINKGRHDVKNSKVIEKKLESKDFIFSDIFSSVSNTESNNVYSPNTNEETSSLNKSDVEIHDSHKSNSNIQIKIENCDEPVSTKFINYTDEQISEVVITTGTESNTNKTIISGADKNSLSSAVTDDGANEATTVLVKPERSSIEVPVYTSSGKKTPIKEQKEINNKNLSNSADSDTDNAQDLFQNIAAEEWVDKKSTSKAEDESSSQESCNNENDTETKKKLSQSSERKSLGQESIDDKNTSIANESFSKKSHKSFENKQDVSNLKDDSENKGTNKKRDTTVINKEVDKNKSSSDENSLEQSIKEINVSTKLSTSLNSLDFQKDRKSLNKSLPANQLLLNQEDNNSMLFEKESSQTSSHKSLNVTVVEAMEVDESNDKIDINDENENNDEYEDLKEKSLNICESNKLLHRSIFDQSVSENENISDKSLNKSTKLDISVSSTKDKSLKKYKQVIEKRKSLNKSANKGNEVDDVFEVQNAQNENEKQKVSCLESLNSSKKSVKSAKNTPIKTPAKSPSKDNDENNTSAFKKKSDISTVEELDSSLQKNIERMKYANPSKSDMSMVAEVGSDSEDYETIPSYIFKSRLLNTDSNDDGSQFTNENNSIDSDVAAEYNLSGRSITKYEDDNVPGDDCLTSEEECSDSEDDGSDLQNFIVSDNSVDESADEDIISAENEDDEEKENKNENEGEESENEENEDKEVTKEEKVVESKLKKDKSINISNLSIKKNKSVNESLNGEVENKKGAEEKSFNDSKISKHDTLSLSKVKSVLNSSKNKSANVSLLNASSSSKSSLKVKNEHENSNVSSRSVIEKTINLSTSSKSKNRNATVLMPASDSDSENDHNKSTVLYESETEPDQSYRIVKVKSEAKLDKSKKMLAKNIDSSTPILKSTKINKSEQQWPWTHYTQMNQTVQVIGNETPNTKYLKKLKLNDSSPILESMKNRSLEEKSKSCKSWKVESTNDITELEKQENETEQLPKSHKKSKKRKLADMSIRGSIEDDSILKEVNSKKKKPRIEELLEQNTENRNTSTEFTKSKKKKNKESVPEVNLQNDNTFNETEQVQKGKKKNKAREIQVEQNLSETSPTEKSKKNKKKAQAKEIEIQFDKELAGISAFAVEKEKKKSKESQLTEKSTKNSVKKPKKKKKEAKEVDIEIEKVPKVSAFAVEQEKKKKKKKSDKIQSEVSEVTPGTVEKQKKKKKKSCDIQDEKVSEDKEEVIIESEKPKKTKKKQRLSDEMSNQENVKTENIGQSKKSKLNLSSKSESLEKKSKKKKKSKISQSDDDEAPESVGFEEARRSAFNAIQQVTDSIKAQKEARTKKKQKGQAEKSKLQEKNNLKRLPDELLEQLVEEPSSKRPIKRQKLSINKERKISENTPIKLPRNIKVDDGYIPLSSQGATTQFGVVQLEKAHKASKINEKVLNFREKLLSRNPRQNIGYVIAYNKKIEAKNRLSKYK